MVESGVRTSFEDVVVESGVRTNKVEFRCGKEHSDCSAEAVVLLHNASMHFQQSVQLTCWKNKLVLSFTSVTKGGVSVVSFWYSRLNSGVELIMVGVTNHIHRNQGISATKKQTQSARHKEIFRVHK